MNANHPAQIRVAPDLDALVGRLADLDGPADALGEWPEPLWQALADSGASRWSIPADSGGLGVGREDLLGRYARVAEGSMTAAFILSQHDAAARRLASAGEEGRPVASRWLGPIARGEAFATVGLSQLTTSRRHGSKAVRAEPTGRGRYRLDGLIPWITAAPRAGVFVVGASTEGGDQVLAAVPADRPGVVVRPPFRLAALQASCTAEVSCEGVEVFEEDLLVDPSPDVMGRLKSATGTGGLETSALAMGQALAAVRSLAEFDREELAEPSRAFADEWGSLWRNLIATAEEAPGAPTAASVRGRANDFVLRATQANLSARKGSGFLLEDPAQRWARQALFFLVWSCPSPVANASVRDFAGLCALV